MVYTIYNEFDKHLNQINTTNNYTASSNNPKKMKLIDDDCSPRYKCHTNSFTEKMHCRQCDLILKLKVAQMFQNIAQKAATAVYVIFS